MEAIQCDSSSSYSESYYSDEEEEDADVTEMPNKKPRGSGSQGSVPSAVLTPRAVPAAVLKPRAVPAAVMKPRAMEDIVRSLERRAARDEAADDLASSQAAVEARVREKTWFCTTCFQVGGIKPGSSGSLKR